MKAEKELQAFENYLRNIKNRSEKTILAYKSDLSFFFSVFENKTTIQSISKKEIEEIYVNALVKNGNSASSRARKLSSVRAFYKWAYDNGYCSTNPSENIEMPKIPQKTPKVMNISEVSKVMETVKENSQKKKSKKSFRDFAILSLMFNTGIRRSELINIKLGDINIIDGSLIVHGKGNKERIVYFNNSTRAVLNEYICSHRNNFDFAETSNYLFLSNGYEKMSERTVNRVVNKYFESANVKEKGYTAHSTRKVFATQVYKNTNDIVAVQQLLGHSNPQTTMHYVGASEQLKRKAALSVNF